jgi:CRISPR/Cas system CMR-associated protein Cmr3 (group 5 of RAMP superfamily)
MVGGAFNDGVMALLRRYQDWELTGGFFWENDDYCAEPVPSDTSTDSIR